ncbi:transcription termination/antitermination factor NusG [Porphyromonas gingivalis]|uniref:transcription termination/antitermination protein NusG n=1 Tax=Porphyromonas gingivalis TaxID=837 RepID=UPI001029008D|nr:transcription termination/antitermination protein NusG [Porphyromonas gingivalis]RZQ69057.1 transcription termination/antitermination factor NusG [Porphyromonas gingivalis]
MTNAEKKFYVLRAISGKENKVREYLEAEMKHSDLGNYLFQVLIPTEKVMMQRAGKRVVKERPYLPGYVLVEAVLVGEVEHRLRSTPNVIGFLGDGRPAPLHPSEVSRILGKVDQLDSEDEEYELSFMVGETVKVSDGAFAGFDAIVEEVNPDKKKLKVMVKIFGRKTALELSYVQVEKE